jgi:hypothetical protein
MVCNLRNSVGDEASSPLQVPFRSGLARLGAKRPKDIDFSLFSIININQHFSQPSIPFASKMPFSESFKHALAGIARPSSKTCTKL